jgi:ABC-type multidrug transport system ATPase subunit
MDGVNGSFKPGRLCAVMGPSGAGKTTIINLVTGKVKPTSGQVFVNGEELSGLSKYQKLVGFVPQDDVMIRELTVRDNISFSANYRLPASLTTVEVTNRVNDTISELGIPHVQHTVIGDEHTRGISGGQRKRVNIAIELVAAPKVLFLDEPTSGLDSTTATSLCHTLKRIAVGKNMTIIAVVHQPSLTSFLEFDDLLLLGKGGRVVYHGAIEKAPEYFASIGFPLPQMCNPADFYLDVVAGAVQRQGHKQFHWSELFDLWEEKRTDDDNAKQVSKYVAAYSIKINLLTVV